MSLVRNSFSMRTGVTHLRSLPTATLLDLAVGQLDDSVPTATLLHEVIHYTCANSAVNVAMQYRWLEVLRLSLSSPNFPIFLLEEQCELTARVAAMEAVLQPLAEGLALFAEFDSVIPSQQSLRPDTIFEPCDLILFRLLSLKATTTSFLQSMFDQLQTEQLGAAAIERKTNILCHPVSPTTCDEAYFIGYLLIRLFWNRCANSGLRPSNLLIFLIEYFYEDWVLVRIIVSGGNAVEHAVARIRDRCADLLQKDIARMVREFSDDRIRRFAERPLLVRGPEEREHGGFAGLGLSSEEIAAGMHSLSRFYQQRISPVAPLANDAPAASGLRNLLHASLIMPLPPAEREATRFDRRNSLPKKMPLRTLDLVLEIPQRKRPFCYLTDIDVGYVCHGGKLHIWVVGSQHTPRSIPMPSWTAIAKRQGQGSIVSVMSSTDPTWPLWCFLFERDELQCSWIHGGEGELNREEAAALREVISNERQMEEATGLSFIDLDARLMRNPEAAAKVKAAADSAASMVAASTRGLFEGAGWAGLFAQSGRADFGLRNLLPSVGAVRAIAAAGICRAFATSSVELAALMTRAGYEMHDALDAAAFAEANSGVNLIELVNGDFVPQI
jgi:hypothetical protein